MKFPKNVFSLRTAVIISLGLVVLYVLALNQKDPITLAAQRRAAA